MSSNTEVKVGDAVTAELTALLARLGELADAPLEDPAVPAPVRIDRIAVLEQMRAALAAAQHTEMVAFGRAQVAEQAELVAAGRLDPEKLGRDIAPRSGWPPTSPPRRDRGVSGSARALATDLPHTRALLAAGRISERLAETVVTRPITSTPRHARWSTNSSPTRARGPGVPPRRGRGEEGRLRDRQRRLHQP